MVHERTQQPASKNVRDLMTHNPECVTEQDTIRDAARIMKNEDTGVVPVVDTGRKIIGLITDRDIVVRGVAEGRDAESVRVSELMTSKVHSVREDSQLDEVVELMRNEEIRRVPVVNQNDEIVGIVSLGDVAIQSREPRKVGRTVQEISEARPNN